jgi:hypothetical protein
MIRKPLDRAAQAISSNILTRSKLRDPPPVIKDKCRDAGIGNLSGQPVSVHKSE